MTAIGQRSRRTGHGRAAMLGAAAVVVAAVAAVPAVLGNASVLVHSCLPGQGMAGWMGLRLALVRVSVECPAGTLAVGPSRDSALTVVVSVAVPLLLAHLAGAGLLAAAASLLRGAIAAVAGLVLPGMPGSGAAVPSCAAPVIAPVRAAAPPAQAWPAMAWRRGPPLAFGC